MSRRRARGIHSHPLRVPALIQLGFSLLFLAAALAFRSRIENNLFDNCDGENEVISP